MSMTRTGFFGCARLRRAVVLALALSAMTVTLTMSPASAQAASRTWYVAPSGSGSACASNSSSQPFATVQAALACAADGDVISLAPSGSTPYPGVGAVTHRVTIRAGSGDARTVKIDLGQPADAGGFSSGLMSVPAGASVKLQGLTLECSAGGGIWCLSVGCENGQSACVGSLVTNNGVLSLTRVVVTASQHGAPINNVSTGSTAAQLTVINSAIVQNSNDGLGADAANAGAISSTFRGAGVAQPQLTVINSTIAANSATSGTDAGAIYTNAAQTGAVTLINDTIAANSGPGGGGVVDVVSTSTPIVASNTLIAGNSSANPNVEGPDCQGTLIDGSGGHNLIGDSRHCSGVTNGVNGDLVSVPNAGLNALAANLAATPTLSLQPQSPAIGAGDPMTCQASPVSGLDQRGVSRHLNTRGCDIGAYDTGGGAGVANHTWYVARRGSDAACSSNSSSHPFATVQAALGCAGDGDVISLAPSGTNPYPGVGAVTHSVTIKGNSTAGARAVTIDLHQPADSSGFTQGLMSVPSSASVKVQGLTLKCTGATGLGCLSLGCENGQTPCVGSLVTNNGALSLTGVMVTGAQHGAAINDVSTGSVPARLTVLDSTIAHNANDGLSGDGGNAGAIYSRSSGAAPQPRLTVANSTIADNSASSGMAPGAINTLATQAGAVTLTNDTITGNSGATGGIADLGGSVAPPVLLTNTVLAGNTSTVSNPSTTAPDCNGRLADGVGGHNLLGDDSNCAGLSDGTNGDQVGTHASPLDPLLGPAAFNGGPTQTAPPLPGSAVIGAANSTGCATGPVFGSDQRGVSRNVSTRDVCDIGAYDTAGTPPVATAPSITSASSATVTESVALSVVVKTTGTPTPAITESGKLPSGVSFTSNGDGTATIAGKPAAGTGGSYTITITASNGVSPAATQAFTLTVDPPPTVSALSPSTLGQGAAAVPVQVNGTNFVGPARVSFIGPSPGVNATVTSTTNTALSIKVSVSAATTPGTYTVRVTDGDGAVASCNGCLTVVAGPTISDISPSSVARGQKTPFTVHGSGFTSDSKLYGPSGVSFSLVSVNSGGTTITATITVSSTAPTGSSLPISVRDGALGNYGGAKDNGLTVT